MTTFLFIGPTEIIIIAIIVVLLFGGRKIPELFRGIGKGIKGFKDEVKGNKPDQLN
jgi:sec-independent protein translocase protein TatA